ncbi:hypothetical protein [Aurantivibrio plasticivorans]
MATKKLHNRKTLIAAAICSCITLTLTAPLSYAGPKEQAYRMHERLTGLPPESEFDLNDMATRITAGDAQDVALDIMNGVYGSAAQEGFLGGTLKRMAAPWTNRDQDPFEPLNDYIATFIGVVNDEVDYREILRANMVYTHPAVSTPYATNSNAHYEAIEAQAQPLRDLQQVTQSSVSSLPAEATAGVMTTRAAAKAFFILGTNRAMLRFTLMSQMCRDLEQMEDPSGVPDRIRQDVSRSPGGDSQLFLTGCVGCHIGMDPLAQAFAYYNYQHNPDGDDTTDDRENGFLMYNTSPQPNPELGIDTRVQPKYHINANNFPYGYVTPDDQWDNYWREGTNEAIGWNWTGDAPNSGGNGAKTMGWELANSYAFAQCQVRKVFKSVCLRDPGDYDNGATVDTSDSQKVAEITDNFRANGFNMKRVFAETADYCKGE